MRNHQLPDFLGLFNFNQDQILKVASAFSDEIQLKRGDFFLKEGAVSKQLAFVLDGMIRYYYTTEEGDEITRWVALKNEFVTSFSSFITQNKTVENIQAIKPTRMLVVSKEKWDALYHEEDFVRNLWTRSIENYLIGMETRVYSLIALNAANRYKRLLKDYPHLVREVPNKYLASMLGIQSRHLSRLRAN